jgi:hypothetical protein
LFGEEGKRGTRRVKDVDGRLVRRERAAKAFHREKRLTATVVSQEPTGLFTRETGGQQQLSAKGFYGVTHGKWSERTTMMTATDDERCVRDESDSLVEAECDSSNFAVRDELVEGLEAEVSCESRLVDKVTGVGTTAVEYAEDGFTWVWSGHHR